MAEYFGYDYAVGILNVDRYSAYKAIAKNGLFILAFCWAHVRRDFLDHAKKLLISLNNHWSGLTIFVDQPEIPMDNNTAERGLRNSVIGRKNYFGSGSIWSAELAAALFTLFKTLKLWEINIHTWLLAYFHECALIGGMPPENITKFLPWEMTEEKRLRLSKPPNECKNANAK